MSAIIPWNDPGGTPCCCVRQCVHSANSSDPLLWDPLTDGTIFSQALQIELTPAQYAMFTSGGNIAFEWNASASASGSRNIPPGNLVLFGEFGVTRYRKVEATFLNNSCKQKELEFSQTALSQTCSSSGFSTGDIAEFYPYMELDYPCAPFINLMAVRLSFYNAPGISGGRLYPIGMYIQFRAVFRILRDLQYGEEGFNQFSLGLVATKELQHTRDATPHSIDLITDEGTIPLPCTDLGGDTASITFTTAAP